MHENAKNTFNYMPLCCTPLNYYTNYFSWITYSNSYSMNEYESWIWPRKCYTHFTPFYSFCRFYRNYVFNLNGMEVIIQQKFPQVWMNESWFLKKKSQFKSIIMIFIFTVLLFYDTFMLCLKCPKLVLSIVL